MKNKVITNKFSFYQHQGLPIAALALAFLLVFLLIAVNLTRSTEEENNVQGVSVSYTPSGGTTCNKNGLTCTGAGARCCSKYCNNATGKCAASPTCNKAGAACTGAGARCCSKYCNNATGKCAARVTPTPQLSGSSSASSSIDSLLGDIDTFSRSSNNLNTSDFADLN